MRKKGRLHNRYLKIEGEAICSPINSWHDLISTPDHINDFSYTDDDFFTRLKFWSMLDYRYANYKEAINQNFRPFKKR